MKKKVGTVIEEKVLIEAKQRAAVEGRPLSDILQEALIDYLRGSVKRGDAEHACRLFCSHGSRLPLEEIDELLEEDMLTI